MVVIKNADRTVNMSICFLDSYLLYYFPPTYTLLFTVNLKLFTTTGIWPLGLPRNILEIVIFANIQMVLIETFS